MKDKVNISLSLIYKSVIIFLMLIIVVMLAVWMPWSRNSESRTISVSGESTIMAEPDRYIFSPNYEFKNKDESVSLNQQSEKSNEIITKLKGLGVKDSDIKNNSSGYSTGQMSPVSPDDDTIYNLSLTITVSDKDLATKVQDYLVSTNPEGQVTPQAGFSETKRKELENQARDMATKDARAKAEQIAKNTGAKLGKVKAIQDSGGFGGVVPILYNEKAVSDSVAGRESIQIQPGENELNYTISVSYYLK